jgi:hypothetical protein
MSEGAAALAAFESVLLLLIEKGVVTRDELIEALDDAAAALQQGSSPCSAHHVLRIGTSLRPAVSRNEAT